MKKQNNKIELIDWIVNELDERESLENEVQDIRDRNEAEKQLMYRSIRETAKQKYQKEIEQAGKQIELMNKEMLKQEKEIDELKEEISCKNKYIRNQDLKVGELRKQLSEAKQQEEIFLRKVLERLKGYHCGYHKELEKMIIKELKSQIEGEVEER